MICDICNPQDRPKVLIEPLTLPTPEEMEYEIKARARDAFENLPSSEERRIREGKPIAAEVTRMVEAQRAYEATTQGNGRRGSIDNPGAVRVSAHATATTLEAVYKLPHQGTKRRICYDLIREAGERGLCDHEIEAATGWLHQSASACRNSLMKDGHVKAGSLRRKTPSGNDSIVWVTT